MFAPKSNRCASKDREEIVQMFLGRDIPCLSWKILFQNREPWFLEMEEMEETWLRKGLFGLCEEW